MGPRRRKSPVYWRDRAGTARAYGDFRGYADVGGGREALVPPGSSRATTDPDLAEDLAAKRLDQLRRLRKQRELLGLVELPTLARYASHHLVQKARAGRVTREHMKDLEHRLSVAIKFLGADRTLASITVRDMDRYGAWLATRRGGRGGSSLSPGTQRHHLNALSNLFRRAASEGIVASGYNPVADMMEKPVAGRVEASFLEVSDAALLLESARTWRPPQRRFNSVYPIIATFLLTGGRQSEVFGLETDDISFDRATVVFRPNQWRRLKTSTSPRVIRLWPQLEEILREHVFDADEPPSQLLFPSYKARSEQPITDIRRSLDTIAERAGWKPGEIRSKAFRHTYCAARLQTLDRGAPVSQWTVARELGHGGTQLVDRVYGHLGQVRHRSEVVEYRVEQHAEELGERLVALRVGPQTSKEVQSE